MEEPDPGVVALLAGAASFFCSLIESALRNRSGPRLMEFARRRNREGQVAAFLESGERSLETFRALSAICQCLLVLSVYVWVRVSHPGSGIWPHLKAGILSALALLAMGQVVPRRLGLIFSEPVLLVLRPAIVGFARALTPIGWVVRLLLGITERMAGRSAGGNGHDSIKDEILSAVEEGEMEGQIREDEADIIEAALELKDADVADCMTPRTRMFALEIGTPLPDAVEQVSKAGHSRVPIYRDNPDEIVGVLYAKDILSHWSSRETKSLTLARIARKPFFVPVTKRISQLLDEFKRTQTHLAVVLDEYGGTAGVVTIEDILEELVGEIEDEFDESLDVPLLSLIAEGQAEVDGHVHVDDLGDALDVEIASDEFDTVGGLVFTVLGRIPETGEEFDYAGMHFTVLDADDRRVNRVKAVRNG